jgi:hypothetical protein
LQGCGQQQLGRQASLQHCSTGSSAGQHRIVRYSKCRQQQWRRRQQRQGHQNAPSGGFVDPAARREAHSTPGALCPCDGAATGAIWPPAVPAA